jgi:hypothetical protein
VIRPTVSIPDGQELTERRRPRQNRTEILIAQVERRASALGERQPGAEGGEGPGYWAGMTAPVVFVRTMTVSYRVSSSAKDSRRFGGWLVITIGR